MPATIRFLDDFTLKNGEPLAYIYYKQEGWFSLRQILSLFLPDHTEQSIHLSVFSAQFVPTSKYYGTKLAQCKITRLRHRPTQKAFRRMVMCVEYILDIQSTRYLLEVLNPKIEAQVLFPFVEVLHHLLKKGGRKRTISTKERMEVAAAQGWTCQSCGQDVSTSLDFEIDHICAFSKGGSNCRLNLQVLCLKCHHFKTKKDQQPIFRSILHEIAI
jgi:hypothetical protein